MLITKFLGLVQSISIAAIDKNSVHFGLWTGSQIKGPLIQIKKKKELFLFPIGQVIANLTILFYLILKVILKRKILDLLPLNQICHVI